MNNTLIDNSCEQLSMENTLKACLQDADFKRLKIASGYWDLPGMTLIYDELLWFLQRDDSSLQLLIGQDPVIRTYQQYQPIVKDAKFPHDYIKKDINELELKSEYQQIVKLLLDYCSGDMPKIEIRIYRQNENDDAQFLHSKCYIFEGNSKAYGIIGSSNFTEKGLKGNAELNYLETTPHIVKYGIDGNIKGHTGWFTEKWEQSLPWNQLFLEEIIRKSPIGIKVGEEPKEITPYDVYIRFLQDLWGDMLDKKIISLLENALPDKINKIEYQFDAVNQGYAL
jgi:hypothetical protein